MIQSFSKGLKKQTIQYLLFRIINRFFAGICVYNVLILSFVGALVSFVVEERNSHYALVATLVWLATTLTLCVIFVPKVI